MNYSKPATALSFACATAVLLAACNSVDTSKSEVDESVILLQEKKAISQVPVTETEIDTGLKLEPARVHSITARQSKAKMYDSAGLLARNVPAAAWRQDSIAYNIDEIVKTIIIFLIVKYLNQSRILYQPLVLMWIRGLIQMYDDF